MRLRGEFLNQSNISSFFTLDYKKQIFPFIFPLKFAAAFDLTLIVALDKSLTKLPQNRKGIFGIGRAEK